MPAPITMIAGGCGEVGEGVKNQKEVPRPWNPVHLSEIFSLRQPRLPVHGILVLPRFSASVKPFRSSALFSCFRAYGEALGLSAETRLLGFRFYGVLYFKFFRAELIAVFGAKLFTSCRASRAATSGCRPYQVPPVCRAKGDPLTRAAPLLSLWNSTQSHLLVSTAKLERLFATSQATGFQVFTYALRPITSDNI